MEWLSANWLWIVLVAVVLVVVVLAAGRKVRADSAQKQLRERHKRETSKPGRG